jgi:hypothetical protein
VILGFAHLALNTGQIDQAIASFQETGFVLRSVHRMVPSAIAKWPLLTLPAKQHDLALMDGNIVLEIISHDTGSVEGAAVLGFDVETGLITLRSRNAARERDFFSSALPCAETDGLIEIRGAFPAWRARLQVVEDATAPTLPPLDIDGFSCLAFYSSNITEDSRRLIALGARDVTGQFVVTVNDRDLSIVMLRSPGGAILELVKVNRS